jgi:hypothetical protein
MNDQQVETYEQENHHCYYRPVIIIIIYWRYVSRHAFMRLLYNLYTDEVISFCDLILQHSRES